jgi:hypothetical protein
MTERVAAAGLVDACTQDSFPHRPLHNAVINVVSSGLPAFGIDRSFCGGEYVLPSPLFSRVGKFPGKCIGKPDVAKAPDNILPMKLPDVHEMTLKRITQYC